MIQLICKDTTSIAAFIIINTYYGVMYVKNAHGNIQYGFNLHKIYVHACIFTEALGF